MENNLDMGREFNWDDVIQNDSDEFILLPEGDYDFEVKSFERGRHTPGQDSKLPPCNKAILKIKVTNEAGQSTTITHNLFLHSRCEGMICAFFTAIGQRKHGEPLRMNWNTVVGSRGRCKVGVRTWKSKSGEDMKSNEIKRFYEPEGAKAQPAAQPVQAAQTTPAPQKTSFGGGFAGGFGGGFGRR